MFFFGCFHRNSHCICQVQVCGEAEWGCKGGELTSQHSCSRVWDYPLFGHVYCCNLPGKCSHVAHILNHMKIISCKCFSTCWFQETTVLAAHYLGALLFFVGGVIYAILQSIISFRAYPFGSSISVCRARLSIAIIATMAFFPSILSQKSIYQKKSLYALVSWRSFDYVNIVTTMY